VFYLGTASPLDGGWLNELSFRLFYTDEKFFKFSQKLDLLKKKIKASAGYFPRVAIVNFAYFATC